MVSELDNNVISGTEKIQYKASHEKMKKILMKIVL